MGIDQFLAQFSKPFRIFSRKALLQMNVFSFDIAEVVECFQENAKIYVFFLGAACVPEYTNRRNPIRRLLGARRERLSGCGSADKPDELPSLHGLPSRPHTLSHFRPTRSHFRPTRAAENGAPPRAANGPRSKTRLGAGAQMQGRSLLVSSLTPTRGWTCIRTLLPISTAEANDRVPRILRE